MGKKRNYTEIFGFVNKKALSSLNTENTLHLIIPYNMKFVKSETTSKIAFFPQKL